MKLQCSSTCLDLRQPSSHPESVSGWAFSVFWGKFLCITFVILMGLLYYATNKLEYRSPIEWFYIRMFSRTLIFKGLNTSFTTTHDHFFQNVIHSDFESWLSEPMTSVTCNCRYAKPPNNSSRCGSSCESAGIDYCDPPLYDQRDLLCAERSALNQWP